MVINILESITADLASRVISQLQENTDDEVSVNIMSQGGDVVAGSAIIDALRISPAKVTTKVFGIAASMAAAISQAGDIRLIAEDALFQPHMAEAMPKGRFTKENLDKTSDMLGVVDEILMKSFSKSNLSDADLEALLIEDKPISASEAIKLAFFDGSMEPIKAAAHLNTLIMSKELTIAEKLKAFRESIFKAEGEPTANIDERVAALEEMIAKILEQLAPSEDPAPDPAPDQPAMEEAIEKAVGAKVDAALKAIMSSDTMPVASTPDLPKEKAEEVASEDNFIELRQKEIQSKFN